MSLYSALRAGVSGLGAQTQAMSMIADNLANINTTGYKAVRARFSSLVGSSTQGAFTAGVVSSVANRSVTTTGQVTTSTVDTHLAVNGSGFFAVANAADVTLNQATGNWENSGEVLYTRAGDFQPDANGNLKNSAGHILLGWPRNESNVGYEVSNLQSQFRAVNASSAVGKPQSTSSITMNANLNANAAAGETFTMTVPMYSRQGGISNIEYKFTKLGDGISQREFTIEARVVSGQATLINRDNALAVDGARRQFINLPVTTPAATAVKESLSLYGVQIPAARRSIVMNFSGPVKAGARATNGQQQFLVEYTDNKNVVNTVKATSFLFGTAKVTVNLDGVIPEDATNISMKDAAATGTATGSFIEFQTGDIGNPPKRFSASGGDATLTIPGSGIAFTGYYDIGRIRFDAAGHNATIIEPDPASRTQALGYFKGGTVTNGSLSMLVDHAADGIAASNAVSTDDVTVGVSFNSTGASAGTTSYESISTIYSIDQNGNGSGNLKNVSFNARGELQATFTRGTPRFLAQVPLVSFSNPNALLATDGNAYRASDSAGIGVSRVAGTADSGTIAGSSLESSNADIATEFTEMIVVQRAYSAATKIITTADEMLEEVIRAKR